jgi:tetratricopeptide (TPR) repeat protein
MTDERFIDFEIRILPPRGVGYPVEITLGGQQEFRGTLAADVLPWIRSNDLTADGQRLFETLFADSSLRSAWAEARGQTSQRRIRLRIDPDAAELHTLPWELMQEGPAMLSAQADTPFSRYLPIELPWGGPVEERPMRVLVVISDPSDIEDRYGLPRTDVELERRTLESAFEDADPSELQVDFLNPPATLVRLEEKLREGYHALHYQGHGAFSDKQERAVLYMQDEEGLTQLVFDDELARLLARQGIQPRLVFLAACQSATRSTGNTFLGMAPKLVSVGVPAVVAMQDLVTVESTLKFSQAFYQRLSEHGRVDLAVNEARSTLLTARRKDATVPVLFMRSPDGCIVELPRPMMDRIASLPLWAKLAAAVVAMLLALTLGTTLISSVLEVWPTPTPDLLPLITTPQAIDEYLVLVADYDGQEEYEAGRRIFSLLSESASYLGRQGRLRVHWKPGVVISSPQDAQAWGERHNATAVMWGWRDGAGFNSHYRLIDADNVPIFDLPEQPFEDEQSLRRYVSRGLPEAANYLALLGTGLTAAYQGDSEHALALLDLAEESWPGVASEEQAELTTGGLGLGDLYWFRAWICDDVLDDPEQAIAEYLRALEIEGPHVPQTHYSLAMAYWRLENLESALYHLEVFVDRAEQTSTDLDLLPAAYQQMGSLLCQLDRDDEEIEAAYDRATQLDPDDPHIPLSCGWCAYLRGEVETAEAYYRRAMEIEPRYPWPYFNLALVHLLHGDAEVARQAYERALELSPDWFIDPVLEYEVALTDLDELLVQHPELEEPARPLRQMLEDALASAE